MKRKVLLAALFIATLARADAPRTITHSRVVVSDLVAHAPQAIASIELGPAPPPGGSRLIGRDEIEIAIRRAGQNPARVHLPASIRIESAARHIAREELRALAIPWIEREVASGVFVSKVDPTSDIVVAPNAEITAVHVPKAPRHKGPFRTTALIEMSAEGDVVARVAVPVVLDVSEEAAHADVPRGSSITISAGSGGVVVTVSAVAVGDANVGDTGFFRVPSTGRTLRARIESRDKAEVVER